MRMITWIIIACLGIGLITYGITTLGEQEASAEISQEAKGSFVRIEDGKKVVINTEGKEVVYPLSTSVWVYRDMQKSVLDQLQAGDALDLILNSKQQAAYIKATSLHFAAAAQPSAVASNNPAVVVPEASASEPKLVEASQSPVSVPGAGTSANQPSSALAGAVAGAVTTPPIVDTKPTNVAVPPIPTPPPVTPSTSPASNMPATGGTTQPPKDVRSQLDKLALEWKSRDLVLKIKREGSGQSGTDVYIQANDKSAIHLTGASAEAVVQQLLQGLPVEQKAFEEQLKSRISTHFQIKDERVEWELDTKWQQVAVPSSNKAQGPQQVKNEEKSWDKTQGRDQDKYKGKGKGKDEDEDDNEKDKDEHRNKNRDN